MMFTTTDGQEQGRQRGMRCLPESERVVIEKARTAPGIVLQPAGTFLPIIDRLAEEIERQNRIIDQLRASNRRLADRRHLRGE